ncbi:MAG: hypothetical protein R3A10_08170 [Caldilineaceae bacterium]
MRPGCRRKRWCCLRSTDTWSSSAATPTSIRAVCTDADDNVTLTEADVNARVADLAARRLRRAGARCGHLRGI